MDFEFSSKEELYQRIKPALHAKKEELHRLGYPYIQDVDIWNFLIENKWKKGKNLMLSDIVSDIIHLDANTIDEYLKGKLKGIKRKEYFEEDLETL